MDCSLPGSSFHGILQVRILEWIAIPFSKQTNKQTKRLSDPDNHDGVVRLLWPFVMLDYTKSLEPWTCVSCCSWVVADAVSAVLEGSAEELQAWKKTLLKACVQWLIASFSGGQQEDGTQDQEKQMLLRFNELLVGVSY